MKLRLATRGSALALAQSKSVAAALLRSSPGLQVHILVLRTTGDRFSAQSPKETYLETGTKGLFVKELEEALRNGRADFAVHSAKDLPAQLLDGLAIAAYPQREDPRDAFIGRNGLRWNQLGPGARIGTSSLRRQRQLILAKPGLIPLPMRGNVDTRLRKLKEGLFDATVLALAGLKRLGLAQSLAHEPLPEELVLPAPGQGALALECRQDRSDLRTLLARLDHPETRREVEMERAFLSEFGGGCSVPLAARAQAQGTEALLRAFYWDEASSRAIKLKEVCRDLSQRESFARDTARRLRAQLT